MGHDSNFETMIAIAAAIIVIIGDYRKETRAVRAQLDALKEEFKMSEATYQVKQKVIGIIEERDDEFKALISSCDNAETSVEGIKKDITNTYNKIMSL